jgi:hypothetical protein
MKDVKQSGHSLLWNTILGTCLEQLNKSTKTSVKKVPADPRHPKFEAGATTTQPQYLVIGGVQ